MIHDRKDAQILALLQTNCRLTAEAIGEIIGLSSTAVTRRLKRLREMANDVAVWFAPAGALEAQVARSAHHRSSRELRAALSQSSLRNFSAKLTSAGVIVRPLGAIVFGPLGDLSGRKYMFLLTMLLMCSSTVLLALLPTCDTLGAVAARGWRERGVPGRLARPLELLLEPGDARLKRSDLLAQRRHSGDLLAEREHERDRLFSAQRIKCPRNHPQVEFRDAVKGVKGRFSPALRPHPNT